MKRAAALIALLCVCQIASAFAAADGWASMNGGTTGGAGGATVTVSSASAFESYVESSTAYIVEVSGAIDLASVGGRVSIRSNKTIRGADSNAAIIGQLGFVDNASNIIIERLTVTAPSGYGEGDGISVKSGVTNLFVTHCTIYDCADGCLDITEQSDYVTVSWCKFYYTDPEAAHRFTMLISASDTAYDDRGKLRITLHHNWWAENCNQRMPMARFGTIHMYNNYLSSAGNYYCTNMRIDTQLLSESNYYDHVRNPIYIEEGTTGKIRTVNNIYDTCFDKIDDGNDSVFTPPYAYAVDDAADVPAIVMAGAGAAGQGLPHWSIRPYGDFDLSGVVDLTDLETFVGFWMNTEGIDNADYDGSGRVDLSEFSRLAANWLYEEPAVPVTVLRYAAMSCRTSLHSGTASEADTNKTDGNKLSVRGDSKAAKSWIKFDITDLDVSSITAATLRVTLYEAKTSTCLLSAVNDTCTDNIGWGKTDITWNNAPGNISSSNGVNPDNGRFSATDLQKNLDPGKTTLIDTVDYSYGGAAGDQFTFDVLSILQIDTDGIVQFVLHGAGGSSNFTTHDSALGQDYWPHLEITYSN